MTEPPVSKNALRVHIGPVQGWIAAGRRTRDFWAGSFLLSRLAGEAMDFIENAEAGSITIPAIRGERGTVEPTIAAIAAARRSGYDYPSARAAPPGPLVGTLVNHFRAEVRPDFDGIKLVEAVRNRFRRLADVIWRHFFEDNAAAWPESVRQRWYFQGSGNYFDVLWVKGELGSWEDESRWLEARKTLRTQPPLDEQAAGLSGTGDRCPVHPDLCELGGFSRTNQREQQDRFWRDVRHCVAAKVYGFAVESTTFVETLEIRQDERLSALALIKRLFPLMPPEKIAQAIGWVPDHMHEPDVEDSARRWDPVAAQRALRNWPSTAFVAAIPWIIEAGRTDAQAADSYANEQYRVLGFDPKWESERPQRHRIPGIDNLRLAAGLDNRRQMVERIPLFAVLDGTLHFQRGLEKHRFDGRADVARALSDNYEALNAAINERDKPPKIPLPKPFYAMLEMDGDSMGRLFSVTQHRATLASKALLEFAAGVPEIVRNHDGVLIYAGADDVNAMLPTATAMDCAQAIRIHWGLVMRKHFDNTDVAPPTLSGSIVFCDYQNALDDMRRLTHARLDAVAKDGMGRDALAIAVVKSGGLAAEWASSWDRSVDEGGSPVADLLGFAGAADSAVASRLPFVIRDRFQPMLEDDAGFDDKLIAALLTKEMGDSGLAKSGASPEEKALAVLAVLRPWGRKKDAPEEITPAPRHVGGLLVARFLAENLHWQYRSAWQGRR